MSEERRTKDEIKADIRRGLDLLQNHIGDDGRVNVTSLVDRVERLERELADVTKERDALLQWQREMVEKAAAKSLAGYRELGAKCAALEAERDALRADAERYRWLANRVLACDYGDNDAQEGQIGWRIRHDLLPHNGGRQPAFMFGPSINAAIDAAMKGEG